MHAYIASSTQINWKETRVREGERGRKKPREKVKKNVRACAGNRIQIWLYKSTIVVAVV